MAGYVLLGSFPTVQVISSTLTQPVQYCTIETTPSNVVASYPVREVDFAGGYAAQVLTDYADGIEYMMSQPHVIGGIGTAVLDVNGLLSDSVVFTVQYTDPIHAPNGVTAEATVPASELYAIPRAQETGGAINAENAVVDAYNSLVAAAGG